MADFEPRDPARIDSILAALREVWVKNPDLRLGQLLFNASGSKLPCPEVFYLEDEALMVGIQRLANLMEPQIQSVLFGPNIASFGRSLSF
jgi:hypothetical protein